MSFHINLEAIMFMLIASLYGAVFGSLPGLTATLALSLFIPIAIFLDPSTAFAAIIGLTATAIFAGDIGAILLRIPGTPASAAYTDEIYEVGQNRSPAYALGIASVPSSIGSLIGTLLLMWCSLALAKLAGVFSSFEYFWLVMLGVVSGVFAVPSAIKGTLAFGLGMLLATIGYDPTLGYPRFTFGNANLLGGIDFIVALIGFFGISEVLERLFKKGREDYSVLVRPDVGNLSVGLVTREFLMESLKLSWRERWTVLWSSVAGTFVGFLPGAGSDFAAWVTSNIQRMLGGNKEQVALAGTAANNAAVAGAWIPALALGIPGDTLTAIVLGVFLTMGLTPGPELFDQHFDVVAQAYFVFLLASVLVMPLIGYLSVFIVSPIARLPMRVLLGAVIGLCLIGTYAINRNPFDLYLMVVMGALGFVLRQGNFPIGQVVLGTVLGPMLERYFMVSLVKTNWNPLSLFERPVALLLALTNVVLVMVMLWLRYRQNRNPGSLMEPAIAKGE